VATERAMLAMMCQPRMQVLCTTYVNNLGLIQQLFPD